MKIGKLPNDILEAMVLSKLKHRRSEVILRPGIGEDCCAVDFGEYACVMSTDPITGTAAEIGRLAVNVSCNDIASCGVEPLGLMVTLLAPPEAEEAELEGVISQLAETAAAANVDILGGHTEVTASVTQFVVVCTAIGKALKNAPVPTGGARAGDSLVLTKHAGLEGAAIIAFENEDELAEKLGIGPVAEAKAFVNSTSVVPEGIAAGSYGVSAMHDVTEGGVLGAVWEMCEASGKGATVYREKIPVSAATLEICGYYGIDPLKLMSSGCMLISCPDGEGLAALLKGKGIPAAVIGRVEDGRERFIADGGEKYSIMPPEADELYKVKGRAAKGR